jgi:hypothetical protein
MWIELADGRRIPAPPIGKSMFGFNEFMKLADLPGSKVLFIDMECSFDPKCFEGFYGQSEGNAA